MTYFFLFSTISQLGLILMSHNWRYRLSIRISNILTKTKQTQISSKTVNRKRKKIIVNFPSNVMGFLFLFRRLSSRHFFSFSLFISREPFSYEFNFHKKMQIGENNFITELVRVRFVLSISLYDYLKAN